MRGLTHWNWKPFFFPTSPQDELIPIVCRVAPGDCRIEFEWYDKGSNSEHLVRFRPADHEEWQSLPLTGPVAVIGNLKNDEDYEFQVCRCDGAAVSRLKYARTGIYPDTVINYIHPREREINPLGYCPCSPTLCRLPSGALLSGNDVWAPGRPSDVAQLFKSTDEGKTWRYVTDLHPCLWPKLFVHRGKLYALSCSMEYGNLQISCSEDEGETWCMPAVLMTGEGFSEFGPHKAPVPVVEHKGRLYTAIEYGAWKIGDHQSTLLSIDADADLMDPANWCFSPFLRLDRSWPGVPDGIKCGYIEGNAVIGPDGELYNLLRMDFPGRGKACLLRAGKDPEAPEEFVEVIDCPLGANSKFEVHRDPVTGKYVMIGTEQVDDVKDASGNPHPVQRLVLSMAVSEDLRHWRVVYRLFDYRQCDPEFVGFQYPSWLISGNDLYVQSRVAINGGETYHNANCEIFSVVHDFRQYL